MAQMALEATAATTALLECTALWGGTDPALAFSVYAGPALFRSLEHAQETVDRLGGLEAARTLLALGQTDTATALRLSSHRFAEAPREWHWEGVATIAPREPVHERPPIMMLAPYRGGKSDEGGENYERSPLTGVFFYHTVVEPSDPQIDAWVTVFEYRDHEGQFYPELLTARTALIDQLGLRGPTDAVSLANLRELSRKVLIQVAQFLRHPTGRRVHGYHLPLGPQRRGLLVTNDENETRLISRFITPNDLAVATYGTGRVPPYRMRTRLIQSVSEILRTGYFLIDALERGRGGAGVRPSVSQLTDAVHHFREAVSRANDASATSRYSPSPEERLEVASFAADLLNVNAPEALSPDDRFRLQDLLRAQERAYIAVSSGRRTVQIPRIEPPGVGAEKPGVAVSASATAVVPKAPTTTRPLDQTAPQVETVQEIAARYYGGHMGGRFGTVLEGTPPSTLFVDGRLVQGAEAVSYWEKAVRFYTNPRFGGKGLSEIWWVIEMADEAGHPIPLPATLRAHYKPRR